MIGKYIPTRLFIASFFVIAKYRQMLKYLSVGDWLNKHGHMHTISTYTVKVSGELYELIGSDFQEILSSEKDKGPVSIVCYILYKKEGNVASIDL